MLTDQELALVERARTVIAGVASDDNHRVAAAAYDSGGRVFTGVNVYHFSGGPCAEPVAMGQAVASEGVRLPLAVMVAVLSDGEIIPPCGRCRQMLFDYYPEIRVIVRGRAGLESMPIRDLLPYPFDGLSLGQQVLYLADDYLDAVQNGSKRTTVRVHDPVDPGPVRLVVERDDGDATTLDAVVTRVVSKVASDLEDGDAVRDGFADRAALLAALARHYPGFDLSATVDIVHFHLADEKRAELDSM